MTAYVGAATKSGRAGIAFPLEWLFKITTFGVTLIICAISLVLWGFVIIWPFTAWGITISLIIWWTVKCLHAYREGRS